MNGRTTSAGERVENERTNERTRAGNGGWRSAAGATVRGEIRFEHDDRGFPGPFGSNPAGNFTGVDTISRGTDDRWGASLGASVPIGRTRPHARAGHVEHDRRRVRRRVVVFADRLEPVGLGVEPPVGPGADRHQRHRRARLSAGAELQREKVTNTYITADSGPIPVKRRVAGYFGEARWSPSDRSS